MIWDIINTFGRTLLTVVAVVLITRYRDSLTILGRMGLGFAGAGSFLTIGIIWERTQSPFEGWATTLLTYGALMVLSDLAWRKHMHEVRNNQTIRDARHHLAGRGKL